MSNSQAIKHLEQATNSISAAIKTKELPIHIEDKVCWAQQILLSCLEETRRLSKPKPKQA